MTAFTARHLNPLVGSKIVGLAYDEDSDVYALVLQKDGGPKKVAWILCDAEGNGPGWLDIVEVKP